MLFDYDDALFIKKPSRYNPIATLLRSSSKTLDIFRLVDCVVAGNDWLRDRAIAEGGQRSHAGSRRRHAAHRHASAAQQRSGR